MSGTRRTAARRRAFRGHQMDPGLQGRRRGHVSPLLPLLGDAARMSQQARRSMSTTWAPVAPRSLSRSSMPPTSIPMTPRSCTCRSRCRWRHPSDCRPREQLRPPACFEPALQRKAGVRRRKEVVRVRRRVQPLVLAPSLRCASRGRGLHELCKTQNGSFRGGGSDACLGASHGVVERAGGSL